MAEELEFLDPRPALTAAKRGSTRMPNPTAEQHRVWALPAEERARDMFLRYATYGPDLEPPWTLQQIGALYMMTRERVRQILSSYYGPLAKALHDAAAEDARLRRIEREADPHYEAVAEAFERLRSGTKVAEELGLSREAVSILLRRMPPDKYREVRTRNSATKAHAKRVPNEQLLDQIAEAAEVFGEPLSRPDYERLARERGWRGPQTIMKRFGTWRNACELAGVRALMPLRGSYDRATLDDVLLAIAEVAEQLGYIPSSTEYEAVARAAHDGSRSARGKYPSLGHVRTIAEREGIGPLWTDIVHAVRRRGLWED